MIISDGTARCEEENRVEREITFDVAAEPEHCEDQDRSGGQGAEGKNVASPGACQLGSDGDNQGVEERQLPEAETNQLPKGDGVVGIMQQETLEQDSVFTQVNKGMGEAKDGAIDTAHPRHAAGALADPMDGARYRVDSLVEQHPSIGRDADEHTNGRPPQH